MSSAPADLLASLDQFICGSITEPMATAAVVIIDPARRTLRYSLAGHPPPLLREPGGSLRALDRASGILLGLDTRDRPEQMISYVPGSSLVLFTDGLVERRGESVDEGLARLARELRAIHQPEPRRLCDILLRRTLPWDGREDDTAVLCAFLSLPLNLHLRGWRRAGLTPRRATRVAAGRGHGRQAPTARGSRARRTAR
jgi:serine phosphatase RsbU (regulator of sigma subunit)